jgi:cell division septation protein DedD
MSKDYVHRADRPKQHWFSSSKKHGSASKPFPWLALLLLLVLLLFFGWMLYTLAQHRLLGSTKTGIGVAAKVSDNAIERVVPIKSEATNAIGETEEKPQPIEFAFYTMLPRISVENTHPTAGESGASTSSSVTTPSPYTLKTIRYILQLGSFSTQEDAQNFQQKLKNKGIISTISFIQKENVKWYRVQMGPFLTTQTAQAKYYELQHKEKIHSIIVALEDD